MTKQPIKKRTRPSLAALGDPEGSAMRWAREEAGSVTRLSESEASQRTRRSRIDPNVCAAECEARSQQTPRIGKAELREAMETLRKYKAGKANLEARIIENEQWYKLRHTDRLRHDGSEKPPTSAWLFNSIANKHADAMDSFPEPNVLPREESDRQEASALSSILPVILEQNGFEQTYSDLWWYKLKNGTGVYGVFWNPRSAGGLGDIEITQLDLLNLYWEPGIRDIQRSRNVFHAELIDEDMLLAQYPGLDADRLRTTLDVSKYIYDDSVDTTGKTAVIDWYYKRESPQGPVLHYCKFAGEEVLYASEDDPLYAERGFYDHGLYPFVFDVLFVSEGTPAGFGYLDIMKDPQMYIDRLGGLMLRNAVMAGKKRFFIRDDGSVNEEEFADWNRDFIHVSGGLGEDSIRELYTQPLSGTYLNMIQMKIDELKETSGNRDFNQGGTNSGVTAASAIAALQEAGSKLSRDMIKSSYRAFVAVNYLCIELIRQFYSEPRCFRITAPQGAMQFLQYDNTRLQLQTQGALLGMELGYRRPVFDIVVTSQKSSPFSKIAQNELAKELYALGFFDPAKAEQAAAAVSMMDFEGKEAVLRRIQENREAAAQQKLRQALSRAQAAAARTQRNAPWGMARETGGRGAAEKTQMDAPRPEGISGPYREAAQPPAAGAEPLHTAAELKKESSSRQKKAEPGARRASSEKEADTP